MDRPKRIALALLAMGLLGLSAGAAAQEPSAEQLRMMQTFLGIMQDYFAVIESAHEINADAEKSAILQLQKIQETYEDRGEKARVIEVLRDVLKSTRNQTIRNYAYMMMGDVLKDTGRSDEAIRLLREGLKENLAAAP